MHSSDVPERSFVVWIDFIHLESIFEKFAVHQLAPIIYSCTLYLPYFYLNCLGYSLCLVSKWITAELYYRMGIYRVFIGSKILFITKYIMYRLKLPLREVHLKQRNQLAGEITECKGFKGSKMSNYFKTIRYSFNTDKERGLISLKF